MKVVCTVLRGRGDSNAALLPDWTRSRYESNYPYQIEYEELDWHKAKNDAAYTLRGGSFRFNLVGRARVANRDWGDPLNWSGHIGFRCVVRLHLS